MKRFYKAVGIAAEDGGWRVTLDGRGVKTVGGRPQIAPTQDLAEALAEEWAAQGEEIVPASFLLRDMADYALDVVTPAPDEAVAALLAYAETDTLCYRGEEGEALHKRQLAEWEPLLTGAEARWGLRFERTSGVIHRAQPPETLARLREVLSGKDAFTLAALRSLASLAASLTLGLLALDEGQDAEALWAAANLEEDWQAELWGWDAEAQALRARRFRDFAAAMRFASLLRPAAD